MSTDSRMTEQEWDEYALELLGLQKNASSKIASDEIRKAVNANGEMNLSALSKKTIEQRVG